MMEDVAEETVITTTITENNEFDPQPAEVVLSYVPCLSFHYLLPLSNCFKSLYVQVDIYDNNKKSDIIDLHVDLYRDM